MKIKIVDDFLPEYHCNIIEKFLASNEFPWRFQNDLNEEQEERVKRTEGLKELIDDILDRHADLKEFEDELKKHKDKITPGQVGES